jgi:tripartite-type tricarboxylate transporter receptor subunit TctC
MIRVSAVLASVLALAPVGAASADYPDKPVRVVVPVAAGGGVDVMARLLAQKLSERLGQQFVVENRAGAAGVIGTKAVIASPSDGTTLLYTPSSLSLTVAVHKTPPYDVAKDLTPIVNVAVSPYALVVHPRFQRAISRSSSPTPRPILASSAIAPPGSAAPRISPASCSRPWRASRWSTFRTRA